MKKIFSFPAKMLCAVLAGIMMMAAAYGEGTLPPAGDVSPEEAEILEIPAVINRAIEPAAGEGFSFPEDAKILHIWFPNVMNADEAILTYDGQVWLIDCGDERMGARGAELIRKLGITSIDKVFNSHPHHDHLNGLKVTDQAAKVEELDICYPANSTKHMKKAMQYAEKNGIRVEEFRDGSMYVMGDGEVTLKFYTNTNPKLDVNNRSAITMVRYRERTILFMGDTEGPGQKDILTRVPASELKADLLKYPHHGKSAMDNAFFEAVSPEAAIVTNKKVENWKGVKFLKKKKVPYLYTNVYANKKPMYIHLMTDGEVWVVERVLFE